MQLDSRVIIRQYVFPHIIIVVYVFDVSYHAHHIVTNVHCIRQFTIRAFVLLLSQLKCSYFYSDSNSIREWGGGGGPDKFQRNSVHCIVDRNSHYLDQATFSVYNIKSGPIFYE